MLGQFTQKTDCIADVVDELDIILCRRLVAEWRWPSVTPRSNSSAGYLEEEKSLFRGKVAFPRESSLFRGKVDFSSEKLTFPRKSELSLGKVYFTEGK